MFETNPRKLDPKREKIEKKRSEVSSRYHSLSYAAEDYDRKKGKGSFAKKFPEANELMNNLLDEKVKIDIQLATEPREEEKSPATSDAPVPTL